MFDDSANKSFNAMFTTVDMGIKPKQEPAQILMTPPSEPLLTSFDSAPLVMKALPDPASLAPQEAAKLLTTVEQTMYKTYPHLVPVIEQMRSALRAASTPANSPAAQAHEAQLAALLSGTLQHPAATPSSPAMPSPLSQVGGFNNAFSFESFDSLTDSPAVTLLSSAATSPATSPAIASLADSSLSLFDDLTVAQLFGASPVPASTMAAAPMLPEVSPPVAFHSPFVLPNTPASTYTAITAASPALSSVGFSTPLLGLDGQPIKEKKKVGRKRKERSADPAVLLAELDHKRQKNTEAARRSRVRKMAELDTLNHSIESLTSERDDALKKCGDVEAELVNVKAMLAAAQAKLAEAGLKL
jgi:hypothetical protein